jgi:hypothetical protein
VSHPTYAARIAYRILERPAHHDARIFDEVMPAHMRIAPRMHFQVNQPVPRQLRQQVIEHPVPSVDLVFSPAVQVHLDANLRLPSLAAQF